MFEENNPANNFGLGDNVRVVSHCPFCNNRYNPFEAKVLEEKINAHLLYIKCHSCQSSILALVMSNPLGISSVGVVTDLLPEEVFRFQQEDAISEDGVLNNYEALQKLDNLLELSRS